MKKLFLLSLFSLCLCLSAVNPARAQSSFLDTNVLNNLPQANSLTNAKLDLAVGAVAQGTSKFENVLDLRYHVTPSFFVGAEIQNSTASSVVDVGGLFLGARKAWDNAEVYGFAGGRRNWINPAGNGRASWEAMAGAGVSYRPFDSSGNILSKTALYFEPAIIYRVGDSRAVFENRAGFRIFF